MPRRQYSDEDRSAALAALKANGGNVKLTAQQVGVPRKTLANWAKGIKLHRSVADMGHQKAEPWADALERLARMLLDAMPSKIGDADLKAVAVSLAIAIDKMQ